ncbi:MAG: plastocyanin/azurin family copper-binding protein [Acidimicrobiia bacterium]
MARRFGILIMAVALATMVAACGGDDDDDDGGGGGGVVEVTNGQVTVEARDTVFNVESILTAPGALEVTLVEEGNLEHTFVVEGADGERLDPKLAVNGDPEDTGSFDLAAGEYEFYCDIPGHRGQGMEGTITVE